MQPAWTRIRGLTWMDGLTLPVMSGAASPLWCIYNHIYIQRFCPCRLLEYRVTFYIQVHFYCAVSQYFFLFNHICEWRVKFFAPHLTLKVRHLIMMEKIQVLVLWPLTKTNEMMVTLNGPYGCNFKYTAYL